MTRAGETRWARLTFVAVASIGLGVSALLLYEYLSPTARFCGDGGGCDAVRHSSYASLLGVPTPVFGVAYFAAALAVALWSRLRRWLMPLSVAGAIAAAVFIALQAGVIGAWCKYCLIADSAGLALAALSFLVDRDGGGLPARLAAPVVAVSMALPVLLGAAASSSSPAPAVAGPLPEAIAGEQRPGVATIVEFLDFECPFCREQHQTMKALAQEYGDRLRVVYKQVPLPGHSHARGAARAYCCADEQKLGHVLADEMLIADDISATGCAHLAERIGMDMDEFGECMKSDRPDERLAADLAVAKEVGIRGLPTFFVGNERMEGVNDAHVVRAAIERALAQK